MSTNRYADDGAYEVFSAAKPTPSSDVSRESHAYRLGAATQLLRMLLQYDRDGVMYADVATRAREFVAQEDAATAAVMARARGVEVKG